MALEMSLNCKRCFFFLHNIRSCMKSLPNATRQLNSYNLTGSLITTIARLTALKTMYDDDDGRIFV